MSKKQEREVVFKLWDNGEIVVWFRMKSKKSPMWYAKKLDQTFPMSEKKKKELAKGLVKRTSII